jgi:hypothetical protein
MIAAIPHALGFTESACSESPSPACESLARHAELRATLNAQLIQAGLSATERAETLAHAVCPLCGQALL